VGDGSGFASTPKLGAPSYRSALIQHFPHEFLPHRSRLLQMWKSPTHWRTDRVFIDQLNPEQVRFTCVITPIP
jgi:hypothetical protein